MKKWSKYTFVYISEWYFMKAVSVIKQYKIFTKMIHKFEIFFHEYFWNHLGKAMLAKFKKNKKPLM